MTNSQKSVRDWMAAFGQKTPEKPCVPSLEVRKLRAKLILEEALETCYALNMHPYLRRNHYEDDMLEEDSYVFWEDKNQEIKLSDIADGCEDLKVVTEGTLVACGLVREPPRTKSGILLPTCYIGVDPLFDEVIRSNWSKMWTEDELDVYLSDDECKKHQVTKHGDKYLVKDSSGKVIKSPSYSPANLQPIIDELSQ